MQRKRLFISFDFDNDLGAKTMLAGQSNLPDTPFDFADASVKKHLTGDWESKVRERIRRADVVCILCSPTTAGAQGVAIELEIAKELGKPYFLLKAYGDRSAYPPKGASSTDKIYKWEWENLKRLIHGAR